MNGWLKSGIATGDSPDAAAVMTRMFELADWRSVLELLTKAAAREWLAEARVSAPLLIQRSIQSAAYTLRQSQSQSQSNSVTQPQ